MNSFVPPRQKEIFHKQQLQFWFRGLAFLLVLSSCTSVPVRKDSHISHSTPAPAPAIRPFIDTWNNIHIFQTFDFNISDPASLADRYDFVWGADIKHVAAFRSGNPNIFISYYIPFREDWGTFTNNKTYHSLAYWKTIHPDWILYKCDQTTPARDPGNPYVPLDFANSAVVAWQVETYAQPASISGYDGIAADNLALQNLSGACGVYIHGRWVQRYTGRLDDPQWRADIIMWLTRMQQALHHLRRPLALIPNISLEALPLYDPVWQQVVNHVDGLLDEGGFTYYGSGYMTGSAWVRRIQFMETVQQQHKPYYIINQFRSVGHAQIQWALASYLMGKEHTAALFISTLQGYGGDTWYSEYGALIGSPLGLMYQAQNVYFRNYSHGLSIVNRSATNTYAVTLTSGISYSDLYGCPVGQTVKLPPHSGLVLLSTF